MVAAVVSEPAMLRRVSYWRRALLVRETYNAP
jgi:hypothetical protein